jgi:Na+/H+-dicarboxylate symporter
MAQRSPRFGTALIFLGLFLGIVLGGFLPQDRFPFAFEAFHFLAKAFINLIKGLIVPLLFSTIVVGIAQTGDIRAVGRMGGKALLYFEIITTAALFIGLAIGNLLKPGANLPLDLGAHAEIAAIHARTGWETALHVFPSNLVQHAAEGDILPVVIFASLFGLALTRTGERGKPVLAFFDGLAQTMFKYTDLIMTLTPIGVFGAMAYNVSAMAGGHRVHGLLVKGWPAVFQLLRQYSLLVASLYLALFALFGLVFVPVMLLCGIRVLGFLRAVKDPALTAYSTASSEAALPSLLERMVEFGVPRQVAGFVIPTGYSFNLDGSTLYLVLASLAIAQAAHIPLSFGRQILMVFTFMLTSKGVAGVPRATLVIIAGTIGSFGLPGEAGVALLLAVDGIMDMARTVINVIGNGLASVVVAKWEGVYPGETPAPGPETTLETLCS